MALLELGLVDHVLSVIVFFERPGGIVICT